MVRWRREGGSVCVPIAAREHDTHTNISNKQDTTHSKPLAFRLSSSLSSTSSSYSFTPLPTPSVVTTPTALTTALKNMHTYHAFPRPSGHGILLLLTTTEEEQRVLLLMGACVPGVKSAVQSPIVGAGSLLSSSLLPLLLQMEGCVFLCVYNVCV